MIDGIVFGIPARHDGQIAGVKDGRVVRPSDADRHVVRHGAMRPENDVRGFDARHVVNRGKRVVRARPGGADKVRPSRSALPDFNLASGLKAQGFVRLVNRADHRALLARRERRLQDMVRSSRPGGNAVFQPRKEILTEIARRDAHLRVDVVIRAQEPLCRIGGKVEGLGDEEQVRGRETPRGARPQL